MLRIDPNWSLVDLDPRTWRNIGHFFNPGQYIRAAQSEEHALFVLHHNGKLLRVVDTVSGVQHGLLDKAEPIKEPAALAQKLFDQGAWDRVHVINKAHLAEVARISQNNQPDSIDHYYRSIYHRLWDESDGYVAVPPRPDHWFGWTYQQIENLVGLLPTPVSCLALGVFEETTLNIGLVIIIENGAITKVTTFETLPANTKPALSADFLKLLTSQLEAKFAAPVTALLTTQAVFDRWLTAETNKTSVLLEAATNSEALWQIAPKTSEVGSAA